MNSKSIFTCDGRMVKSSLVPSLFQDPCLFQGPTLFLGPAYSQAPPYSYSLLPIACRLPLPYD